MADRVVVHLRDRRPIWSMPGWVLDEVQAALPEGWSLEAPDVPADGSGDGAGRVPPAVLEAVADARIYMGFGVPADVLRAGDALEWVHSGAAGVGGSLTPEMRATDVVFTNSAGIHGPPMAETVLAAVLHFLRGVDFAVEGKRRGRWWPDPFLEADTPVAELSEAVVGVIGYGGVGREVARRASALGARVLGLRRHPPEGADRHAEILHGRAGLERLLGRSDVVVVCVPETDETRGLLDRTAFARMKQGAIVVNVARGGIVDEDALLEALRSGRLRGAALDVFAREPLPDDHPFWEAPNLLLTPHVSAVSRRFWRRETDLILDNLERFLEGRPLRNRVDPDAGY